jgi:hypothetical protein
VIPTVVCAPVCGLTRCMCEWNGRLDQAGVGEGAARKRSDLADCASVGAGGAGGEGGGV